MRVARVWGASTTKASIVSWGFEVLVPLPVQKCSIFAKFITIFNDIVKLLSHFMEKIVTEFGDSQNFSINLVTFWSLHLVTKLITKFVPKIVTKCNTEFNTQFGDSQNWTQNLSQKLSRNLSQNISLNLALNSPLNESPNLLLH